MRPNSPAAVQNGKATGSLYVIIEMSSKVSFQRICLTKRESHRNDCNCGQGAETRQIVFLCCQYLNAAHRHLFSSWRSPSVLRLKAASWTEFLLPLRITRDAVLKNSA